MDPVNFKKSIDYEQLLALTQDLLTVFDEQLQFVIVSDSCLRILGYTPDELIGKKFLDFVHPDDQKITSKESKSIYDGNSVSNFENRYIHKNGSTVHLQWSSKYDEVNKRYISIARDITQKKEREEKEQIDNEINKALVNSSSNLIWSLDKELKFTGFNNAFKQSREEEYSASIEIGLSTFDSMEFPEEVKDQWIALYNKVLAGEKVELEYNTSEIEKKSDDIKWYKIELNPIYNKGEIIGIIGNSSDITELKKTSLALAERNDLIETVIREIPMGIAVNEIDTGKAIFVNEQFSEVYNWPVEVLTDVNTFLQKVYPPEEEESQKYLQQIISDIQSQDPSKMQWKNVPVYGQNGRKRYVNAKNIPLYDLNLMISTVQDHTDYYLQKQALEIAFKEKNEILDGISDAFYTLDNNYNFTYLNRHSLNIMGVSSEELIGKNLFVVFPELAQTAFKDYLDEVKETGESAKFELYYEHWKSWFDERIYKTPSGFSVFFVDISLKKNFSIQLEAAYGKQKEILESITDSFIALDMDLCFTYINQEAQNVFNLERKSLLGKNIESAFRNDDLEVLINKFKETIKANAPRSFEYFNNNNHTWFFVNTYPTDSGLSVYLRDMTDEKNYEIELKKLNKTLKQKNEELEQFAFVASHDLQEPLRIISSFLELLKSHLDGNIDETSEKYINYSIDGSHRMKQIITDLLDYSRAGTHDEKQELIDCNQLIEEVKNLLEETISSKEAVINFDQLPKIYFNRSAIRQVFMNLIGNGLKYIKNGTTPQIIISAEQDSSQYTFSVKDNGIGIQKKHQEKIFTIFQRLHNRSEYSGTGIGLAITKKIIVKHGGKIWISSEIGKGSTFHFTIPRFNIPKKIS